MVSYKRLYFTGIPVYVILLVISVCYYKERTILADSAYTLFNIAKDGTFLVNISRLGGLIAQSPAVIAVKAGLSLRGVMVCYSAGYALYYLACYLLCGIVFRQYAYGLVLVLFNTLFTSETFYFIPSELPQGIAFLLVLAAYYTSRKGAIRGGGKAIIIAALVLLTFFHPLVAGVLLFMAAYSTAHGDLLLPRRRLYITGLIFFIIFVLKTLLIKTQYDAHSASGLKNFVTLFPLYFTQYSDKLFLSNCLTRYYWIPILTVGITIYYLKLKRVKEALLVAGFTCGYIFVVNVAYPTPVTATFYIENLYAPVGIFLALPFVYDILPALAKKKLAYPALLLILISGIVRMYAVHKPFTERVTWERNFLKQYGDKKIIANANTVHADILQMLWGTPYEFWLLSTVEQGSTASAIIDEKPMLRAWAGDEHNRFVVNWNIYPYKRLPAKYFIFRDTVSGYTVLP